MTGHETQHGLPGGWIARPEDHARECVAQRGRLEEFITTHELREICAPLTWWVALEIPLGPASYLQ